MSLGENQTSDEALDGQKPGDKGSGVFAVPDPTSPEQGAFKKVIVSDITYPDCVRRGQNCMVYKWLPKKLSQGTTECPTKGVLCNKSCAHDLCLCINGTCQ
ncbi:hypothetical protein GGD66_008043 [Bradyrhizobium sp. CIR48]|uniref:hypothetical protein n=1 Tax=Bradyrhizobium sp. CIR48 TaxID=2663840 RepID=UPI00160653DD|nr:hypothetical protein [Bradyrhizobium sp. CIR48]MBB4429441.1 hypothetical protein [Bradyrhizobium sp. CIR48]